MQKSKKILFLSISLLFLISALLIDVKPLTVKAATHDVTLTTSVQSYLVFDITVGDTIALGDLTPGTPICSSTTTASVTTNAANGYTLGLHDGVASTGSALLHTDTTTRITDMTNGTIASPVVWGTNTGLGVNLWDADTAKSTSQWGAGTTVCDALNEYAAVPTTATTAHTVTGFHSGADTSDWSWKIDVPNTQKTGAYSGVVTFTATPVLS